MGSFSGYKKLSAISVLWIIMTAFIVDAGCPEWCNNRGYCTSAGDDGHCICDSGFTGDDCSQKFCPAAFDPIQLLQPLYSTKRRQIRLESGHVGGYMYGQLSFSFGDDSISFNADAAEFTSQECERTLQSMKSLSRVSCQREKFDAISRTGSYLITLEEFPLRVSWNNLKQHNGNPPKDFFACNTSKVDPFEAVGAYCRITDVNTEHIPLYAECGNHGTCHRYYGQCACEPGFHGPACQDISDGGVLNQTTHVGNFFTGSMMKLQLVRSDRYAHVVSPKEYTYMDISLNEATVTKVRGDGMLYHHGKMFLEGDMIVGSRTAKYLFTKQHGASFSNTTTVSDARKRYDKEMKSSVREVMTDQSNTVGLAYFDSEYAQHYERLASTSQQTLLHNPELMTSLGEGEEVKVHYESANIHSLLFEDDQKDYHLVGYNHRTHRREGEAVYQKVFGVDASGKAYFASGVTIGSNLTHPILTVDEAAGKMQINQDIDVTKPLQVHNTVHVDDKLTVGKGSSSQDTMVSISPQDQSIVFNLSAAAPTVSGITNPSPAYVTIHADATAHGEYDDSRTLLHLHSTCPACSLLSITTAPLVHMDTLEDGSLSSSLLTSEETQPIQLVDINTAGQMTVQSLVLQSGGLSIRSGGISVAAGGLSVAGGLTLQSGALNVANQVFQAGSLHAEYDAQDQHHLEKPLLSARVTNKHYVGNMLELKSAAHEADTVKGTEGYNFIALYHQSNETVNDAKEEDLLFRVTGEGRVESFGGSAFYPPNFVASSPSSASTILQQENVGLEVFGKLAVRGDLHFTPTVLTPQRSPSASSSASTPSYVLHLNLQDSVNYLIITQPSEAVDSKEQWDQELDAAFQSADPSRGGTGSTGNPVIEIILDTTSSKTSDAYEMAKDWLLGKVMIVQNEASYGTTGWLHIPANTTVMFVYNGRSWVSLDALRAPLQSLEQVESFQAANDLHIGNHTFSASRLQSTYLTPGHLVLTGRQGILTESDHVTYSKGVLTVPALKTDKFVSNVDMKGNELQNAVMVNGKLVNAKIHAQEIVFAPPATGNGNSADAGGFGSSSKGGLAYFNEEGKLSLSPMFLPDAMGRISFTDLYNPLHMHDQILSHAHIQQSTLSNIDSASVATLLLTKCSGSSSTGAAGHILYWNSTTHQVDCLPASLVSYHPDKSAQSLTWSEDMGWLSAEIHQNVSMNGHALAEVVITSGTIQQMDRITTQQMTVSSLAYHPKQLEVEEDEQALRIVYATPSGDLVTPATSSVTSSGVNKDANKKMKVTIPHLTVESLSFAGKDIDFADKMIHHAKFNLSSMQFVGSFPSELKVPRIKIESLASVEELENVADGGEDVTLVGYGSQTKALTAFPARYNPRSHQLHFDTKTEVSINGLSAVSTKQLQLLPSTPLTLSKSGKLVGMDEQGFLHPVDQTSVANLAITSRLTVQLPSTEAFLANNQETHLGVQFVPPPSSVLRPGLVGVNKNGYLTQAIEDMSIQAKELLVKEEVVVQGHVKTNQLVVQDSFVFQPSTTSSSTGGATTNTLKNHDGNILITNQNGEVSVFPHAQFSLPSNAQPMLGGSLSIHSLYPFVPSNPSPNLSTTKGEEDRDHPHKLHIHESVLHSPSLYDAKLRDTTSITTKSLTVSQEAQLECDLMVAGNVMVYGSVMGSGPYVDASDRALKTAIRPIQPAEALSKVRAMQGVTYEYRQDVTSTNTTEVPPGGFPQGRQIGWIAQEMEEIVPEVVVTNPSTGFKSIAYSHVTPLLVEAMKEMQEQHEEEIQALKTNYDAKLEAMQAMMDQMQKMLQEVVAVQQQPPKQS